MYNWYLIRFAKKSENLLLVQNSPKINVCDNLGKF